MNSQIETEKREIRWPYNVTRHVSSGNTNVVLGFYGQTLLFKKLLVVIWIEIRIFI